MIISDKWKDYEILDAGRGLKLERWGKFILSRPDPQAIWAPACDRKLWEKADAAYNRSSSGGGSWDIRKLPAKWTVEYYDLKFLVEPTGFKHTGVFPEQAANWDWLRLKIVGKQLNVLNLFGYTGCATAACAAAGASVCHVDASKGMVARAAENVRLSGLENAKIRYIVDDCFKFVGREIKRGKKYHGIILDPPSYGRGPGGEVWKLEENLYGFLEECVKLLSDDSVFLLLNSY
ncbi:MAG: class I SAM-dependent methyltransferase, partial [Clostridiales bacterium]|nr:class I SAM-dependent methyltransferase [Clostridiales bacterium]